MPRFANLATDVLSVALTLSVCELALRWLGWGPNASVTYRWMGRRIVETTNSFCEGYLVNDDEVFSAVFARRQSRFAPVNLGVAGYSTDQAYLLHQLLSGQIQPRQVVLLFFDNDVWFNSVQLEHRAPKPSFLLTPAGLQLTGTPIPPPAQRAAAAPRADCPPSWRLRQLFAQARTTVAAIYDSSWTATKQVYGMEDGWDIHLPETRLAALCARQGIPFLSPTARLRERAARGETLYFLADGHWNRAGHQLAGEMLAGSLLTSSSQ